MNSHLDSHSAEQKKPGTGSDRKKKIIGFLWLLGALALLPLGSAIWFAFIAVQSASIGERLLIFVLILGVGIVIEGISLAIFLWKNKE